MSKFVHLHVHSEYSLLDGLAKIPKLVSQAKIMGMKHLALTDHGSLYGAIKFYKECTKEYTEKKLERIEIIYRKLWRKLEQ